MCTSDAWSDKDSMEQCSGDLYYSEESEKRAVLSACMVTWLIEDVFNQHSLVDGTPRWPCSLRDERVFMICSVIQGP